ncbi:MAG TPA: hypothetical protein PLL30_09215 [Candidatus Krumholzibacteria bacterium]|nr:hypothetical protein [Candidatus Krumholzibacteria bacterium]HPD71940.1 hypothetical protein [Candidatus Krumholzibacteria bacterium]HRY41127.1 hypothetical protein [Candidatus Krumholzibacteria bacterium]
MWRKLVVGLSIFLAVLLQVPAAEAQSPLEIRCQWWPPQSGSAADRYNLVVEDVNNGDTFTYSVPHQGGDAHILQEFVFTEGLYGREYRARVRALDDQNRAGPWSTWSVVYVFEVPEP